MQNVSYRIKISTMFLLSFTIFFLIVFSTFAQKKQEVLLKFNKQNNLMRIVFEAEEQFVNKAKITTTESQIKIDFNEPFLLTSEKELPFEILPAEKSIIVSLKEKSEIKIFRLAVPPRLVFDIKSKELEPEKEGEKVLESQQIKEKEVGKTFEKLPMTRVSKEIIIDPGHGGYEFGITSGNVNEKNITLDIAKSLSEILSKKGRKILLSRKADQFLSINERINFVNRKTPYIFISLHVSTSNNFIIYSPLFNEQSTNDIADFYSISSRQRKYILKSKDLAQSIGKALKEEFKMNVIRREMPLPILQSTGAPAILIELPFSEFMTYKREMTEKLANSIIKGIELFEKQ